MSLKSVKTLTASEIAKKWKLSQKTVNSLIDDGAKVEHEHDKDMKNAKQIARDHISERPDYYKKLSKMEKTKIKLNELGEYDNKGGSRVVGDLTGSSRKVMKVDEVKLPKVPEKVKTKAKKAVAVGMTAANLATGADIYDRASRGVGSPIRDVAAAASGLPGKVGYAAMGANWTVKGFDKAKEHIRTRQRAKMEEQGSPANPARYTERPMYERRHSNELPSGEVERGIYEGDPMKNAEDKIKAAFTADKVKGMFKRVDKERDKDPKWVAYKKRKQQSMKEEQIDEISAELVGKVSNARFWRKEVPSKTLTRAINKKFIEIEKKKEEPKKPLKEETTMDTKDLINEALDNILENNLVSMKENLMAALQEKSIEKIEEKKKEIAANYFGQ